MIQSTWLAKAAYWLGGELSRIQTNQQTYELVNPQVFVDAALDGSLPEIETRPAGKMKLPCGLSVKLLSWSQDLDRKHWDHWALQHMECEGTVCSDCNGHIDPPLTDEW